MPEPGLPDQRRQCQFPSLPAVLPASIPPSPELFLRCPPEPCRPPQVTVTKQPRGSSSKKRAGGPTWEIDFHLLCPSLSAKGRDLGGGGENLLLQVEKKY